MLKAMEKAQREGPSFKRLFTKIRAKESPRDKGKKGTRNKRKSNVGTESQSKRQCSEPPQRRNSTSEQDTSVTSLSVPAASAVSIPVASTRSSPLIRLSPTPQPVQSIESPREMSLTSTQSGEDRTSNDAQRDDSGDAESPPPDLHLSTPDPDPVFRGQSTSSTRATEQSADVEVAPTATDPARSTDQQSKSKENQVNGSQVASQSSEDQKGDSEAPKHGRGNAKKGKSKGGQKRKRKRSTKKRGGKPEEVIAIHEDASEDDVTGSAKGMANDAQQRRGSRKKSRNFVSIHEDSSEDNRTGSDKQPKWRRISQRPTGSQNTSLIELSDSNSPEVDRNQLACTKKARGKKQKILAEEDKENDSGETGLDAQAVKEGTNAGDGEGTSDDDGVRRRGLRKLPRMTYQFGSDIDALLDE